jgi:hypothetical protein
MSANILADKDINAAQTLQAVDAKSDIKSMEYHRQVLQSRLDGEKCVSIPSLLPPSLHASDACILTQGVGASKPTSLPATPS